MNKNAKRPNNTGTVLFEQNTLSYIHAERDHLVSVRQVFPWEAKDNGNFCLFITECGSVVLSLRELSEKFVSCGASLCALDICLERVNLVISGYSD